MIRKFSIPILFLLATTFSFAQGHKEKQEKIKALKVAFITEKLEFTSDEAQKFWPIHTEYDNELRASSKDLPELERQQLILNIKKKYQPRFSKVLGQERTDNFFKTDAEFRKRLLERVRKSKQQRGDKPRRPQ